MRDLNYQSKQLCFHNRDGSFSTQANRAKILNLVANQLVELGYRRMGLRSLKPKHVDALVKRWLAEDLSSGTIKNRMNCLRWWAAKVNRSNVVARSNEFYGIPDRSLVVQWSKATEVTEEALANIADPYVRVSLELQRAFGLRREEAIKFMPSYADRGNHLHLKPSWTKGRRARDIPIRTRHQRELLTGVHELAKQGALIPASKSYIQQLRVYERQTARAGLSKLHGLRHAYAQSRYRELTGWEAPACGGPSSSSLSGDQKAKDHEARLIISQELGHSREQISAIYLSR